MRLVGTQSLFAVGGVRGIAAKAGQRLLAGDPFCKGRCSQGGYKTLQLLLLTRQHWHAIPG